MKISLIVPVYNEEQAIGLFYQSVREHPQLQDHSVEIVFINDGSSDQTAALAREIALADSQVVLIDFSRNFGKEPALFAGIEHASGDVVIPMDVDLQDPIDVIPRMIEQWHKGAGQASQSFIRQLPEAAWSGAVLPPAQSDCLPAH
jgi:glycosyltransferase involved in cell wall biosynthesis